MKHSADATRSTPDTPARLSPARPVASTPELLESFLTEEALLALIRAAREEDLGPRQQDVTSTVLADGAASSRAAIHACAPGILCGAALLPPICQVYGGQVLTATARTDGKPLCASDVAATLTGPLDAILTLERVALNFITWLSGIATLTAHHVAAVAGTEASICDTRKTHPSLRRIEKYAVACGGGSTHRMGLYDAALLKDNHIAHLDLEQLAPAVTAMACRLRALVPAPRFVAVEVDNLEQFKRLLACDVDIILLDNMTIPTMRKAVTLRNAHPRKILLEASGGVTLANVGEVAKTGVDRISVGALTHSAAALDFTMAVTTEDHPPQRFPPPSPTTATGP